MPAWDDILPDADRAVYEKGGWGKPRPRGERPVILVIDAMYTFTGDYPEPILDSIDKHRTSCGEVSWPGVANIAALLDVARPHGIPVVYTVMEQRRDFFDRAPVHRGVPTGANSALPTDLIGSYANEPVAEIAPAPEDIIITKPKPSAFFGTPLVSYLTYLQADSVILTGCVTSGCIRAAAVDASSYNYLVVVPEECVWDRAELPHKANLFDIQMKCGDVEPVASTKDWVLSLPERPFGDKTPTRRMPAPEDLPTIDQAPVAESALR
ncbi:MAG TPA: isochorismatase family protein [Baekduia sp.]|nr:isochorismatase family protein [Baekduia sp.]